MKLSELPRWFLERDDALELAYLGHDVLRRLSCDHLQGYRYILCYKMIGDDEVDFITERTESGLEIDLAELYEEDNIKIVFVRDLEKSVYLDFEVEVTVTLKEAQND